jgi:MFS family permease
MEPSNKPAERPTGVRHLVLAALLAITTINYVQRNSISPAETTIREDLDLKITQTGHAVSAFFITYALLQIPSGWLAQRWGARRALAFFAAGWSVVIGLTALASGLAGLLAARLALGALQAGIFPCATLVLASWYPASRRGLASALLNSFMLIGSAVGSVITGVLLEPLGWRWLFALYAVPGLAWSLWFLVWFRNRPQDHPGVNPAELAIIADAPPFRWPAADPVTLTAAQPPSDIVAHLGGVTEQTPAALPVPPAIPATAGALRESSRRGPLPWGAIFLTTALVLLYVQQFCRAGANRFFDLWLATYLQEERGLSKAAAGVWASLPQWTGVVGGIIGGILSDAVLRRTGSLRAARTGVAAASLAGAVLCYLIAYPIPDPRLATAVASLGAFLFTFSSPCSYALTMDLGGRYVGIVFAVMNMAGNLGAFSYTWLTPQLTHHTGGWDAGLALFLAMHAVAIGCWLLLDPTGVVGEPRAAAGD